MHKYIDHRHMLYISWTISHEICIEVIEHLNNKREGNQLYLTLEGNIPFVSAVCGVKEYHGARSPCLIIWQIV